MSAFGLCGHLRRNAERRSMELLLGLGVFPCSSTCLRVKLCELVPRCTTFPHAKLGASVSQTFQEVCAKSGLNQLRYDYLNTNIFLDQ